MNSANLIYPMGAMVLLTVIVLAALFRSRVRAVKNSEISAGYFKTYQGATEPDSTVKLSRHFANIFESPTLFYVACLAAMVTQLGAPAFAVLAWIYVVLRAIHAYVHTGSNKLNPRIAVYFASWVILTAMWVFLVVHASTF